MQLGVDKGNPQSFAFWTKNGFEVLREDGSTIEGLYAAGETCNGEYYYRLYPSGGASLLFGSVTGKIAGANAAKLAAEKA